jgi:hypothetical protein
LVTGTWDPWLYWIIWNYILAYHYTTDFDYVGSRRLKYS